MKSFKDQGSTCESVPAAFRNELSTMFHILTHASQESKLAVPFCTAARAVPSGTIPGTQNILEVLLESRFNSLERLVALQVMFYHMTARVAAFWYALAAQIVALLCWPLANFLTIHHAISAQISRR